jgi:hypothetical protein
MGLLSRALVTDMGYGSGEFEMSGKIANRQRRPQQVAILLLAFQ